jgi:adenylate kinase family enzyme
MALGGRRSTDVRDAALLDDLRGAGPACSSETRWMSEPRSALGRRIVITGLAGSGKSTLAVALAARTGLPIIHLDLFFWKPGWVAPSETEWREKQRAALAGDAWIADGNYHETLDLRLERANTLVILHMPWWLCSGRALARGFRMPGELPPGCTYSHWARWRDEWRLAVRIWRKRHSEPEREREVVALSGQHVAVHVLTSAREVSDFLDGLDADRATPDDD